MTTRGVLLSAVLLQILGAASVLAQTAAVKTGDDLGAALEREIPQLLKAAEIPGLSIAVVSDRRIVWSGAFGMADPATGAPVQPDTVFHAASLSKPVFAYLVLRLADRGVLDLDAPLASYLTSERIAPGPGRAITARQVLTHTSGLPNWSSGALDLAFPPGERWSYSSEGFVYLQQVVEKLTGAPLAELARREVLEPLGMTRSSFVWEASYQDRAAHGVDLAGNVVAAPMGRRQANAASSLSTTAGDYARFLLAVLDGKGLTPASAAAMLAPRPPVPSIFEDPTSPPQAAVSWGLGWGIQRTDRGEIFWHWGHEHAWRAYTATLRDGSAGLVYFANSHEGLAVAEALTARVLGVNSRTLLAWLGFEPYDAPRQVARREIQHALAQSPEAGARRCRELRDKVDSSLILDVSSQLLDGDKAAAAAALLQVVVEQEPRSAKAHDRLGGALLAAGRLTPALASFDTALRLDPASPPREAERRWIHEALAVERNPVSLSEEALRRYAGDYGPRHVVLLAGRLTYRRDGQARTYTLVPLGDHTFAPEGDGSFRIRFVPAEDGAAIAKVVLITPEGPYAESPRD
jgi:CubicO group peptidase (beta-lactamase class C family)